MVQIPGIKKRPFWDREWVVETVAALPPVAGGIVGGLQIFSDPTKPQAAGWALVAISAWILATSVLKIVRARRRDCRTEAAESPTDLLGCTHVLNRIIRLKCGVPEPGRRKLRMTIHRVVPPVKPNDPPTELEQVIPYVGGRGGEPGRRFSIKSGVIGEVARNHEARAFSWNGENTDQLIHELMASWNYTEDEAEELVKHRRSWFAVPISGESPKDTIGVVFFDSDEPDFFNDEVKTLAIGACLGIADFISQREATKS